MDMRKVVVFMAWCLAAAGVLFAQQSDEQLAAYYYDHGEYAQAAQLYEGLYKRGTNKYYYQRLLSTYLELGQYKDALQLVERRQKRFPMSLHLSTKRLPSSKRHSLRSLPKGMPAHMRRGPR